MICLHITYDYLTQVTTMLCHECQVSCTFDDPCISWLKDQFLKHFEDWLTTNEKHVSVIANKSRA